MTRLEVLKAEKEQIKGLRCLSFGLIDKCIEWYDKEIEAIVIHGADNKFYGQQVDEEHDGCKDCVYQANPQDAMPCRECKQNYMDKWKAIPNKVGHCEDCKQFRKLPYHADTLGRCIHHAGFCPKGDWYCADFEMD